MYSEPFFPKGFLSDYLAYARRLTDAPDEFHLFTGLTVLGAAAARVRIPFGAGALRPVLWTVLAAPTAFYRKTTAMEIGRRVLARACPQAAPATVYEGGNAASALRAGEGLVALNDFSWLITLEARERLTQLDDTGAPVSLLASASTPELASHLSATDLAGGYLNRFLFVAASLKSRWRSEPGPVDDSAEQSLAALLARAAQLEGAASLAAYRGRMHSWNERMFAWIKELGASPSVAAAGLVSRLQAVLLKLAVLVEISASGTAQVSEESFHAAEELSVRLRAGWGRLLTEELPRGNAFREELRVLSRVRSSPGITRRRLQQNSHLPASALRRALDSLAANGKIARDGRRFFPARAAANNQVFAEKCANGHRAEWEEVKA